MVMKSPDFMIQSTTPGKMDRLAAFIEVFKLRIAVVATPHASSPGSPALLLAGSEDEGNARVVFRLHGFSEVPDDVRVVAEVNFDNEANPLMSALPDEISVPLGGSVALQATAMAFLSEAAEGRCGRSAALNRLAEVLMLMVLRSAIDSGAQQPGLLAGLAHASLHRALVSIHEMPAHPWTVDDLAASAAMSRSAFMSSFRTTVGMTPMAYLGAWRLTLARRHLKAGEAVKLTARRAGFGSAAAFSRAFSRAYGHAPADLKRAGASAL
jgi:AraC-like DNA-binding protein